MEQHKTPKAASTKALREAARVGLEALDRGEFKEFDHVDDLRTYLNRLSEEIISRARK